MDEKTYEEGDSGTCMNCLYPIQYVDWIHTGNLYWIHVDHLSGLWKSRDCYPTPQASPMIGE